MSTVTTRSPSVILPDALYSRRGFIVASGLSEERLRQARRTGLEPRKLWVGKRCYIRGVDAILFIEELAAAEIRACTTYSDED